MALSPDQVSELVALIKMVDFLDTFGRADERRKELLTEKATPKQFLAALRMAGYHEYTVWDTYPHVNLQKWPSLEEALREIGPRTPRRKKAKRKKKR